MHNNFPFTIPKPIIKIVVKYVCSYNYDLYRVITERKFFIDHIYFKKIRNPSTQICLEAVKQNGLALNYVKKQINEICLEAIKRNGLALEYVREQTDELCLEAVKQNGKAFKYVNKKFKACVKNYKCKHALINLLL